jgi:hypothetical protein
MRLSETLWHFLYPVVREPRVFAPVRVAAYEMVLNLLARL